MRLIFMLLLCVMFAACAISRYKFDDEQMRIYRSRGNYISSVYVLSHERRNGGAIFHTIKGKNSIEFSLKTFSPECFECTRDSYKFDTGVVYDIEPMPSVWYYI